MKGDTLSIRQLKNATVRELLAKYPFLDAILNKYKIRPDLPWKFGDLNVLDPHVRGQMLRELQRAIQRGRV